MKNYALLFASVMSNLFGSILKKDVNTKYSQDMFSYQFYNAVVSFVAAIVLILMSSSFIASSFTVIAAIIFGVITLMQQVCNLYALECGPLSYTTLIISLSTLIPTLSGVLFWNESISLPRYIGIAFLVLSFICSVNSDREKKTNFKWLCYSLIAFICTGVIGVMQKIHQTSQFKDELDMFLIIAFVTSFVLSFLYSLICFNRHKLRKDNKKSILNMYPITAMIISGLFVAINNKFNLYLSGVFDSAFFFPVVNGGGLILTSLSAFILFKEKLSRKQLIGLIFGLVAVILLCF